MTAPDHTLKPFKNHLHQRGHPYIHKSVDWQASPFPQTDLSHGLCDRDAERGVAVQNGDTDLELGDLTVEVPSHEPLAQQFHAMHLRLDAASAVISAPSSPDRAAEVFRCPQCFVSCDCTGGDSLPRFGVLAGRDDGVGAAVSYGIVAFACVVGPICCDAADFLVRRDLAEQVGQNRCELCPKVGDGLR